MFGLKTNGRVLNPGNTGDPAVYVPTSLLPSNLVLFYLFFLYQLCTVLLFLLSCSPNLACHCTDNTGAWDWTNQLDLSLSPNAF